MIELDRLDRKILCELERDAHLTNIKLADKAVIDRSLLGIGLTV